MGTFGHLYGYETPRIFTPPLRPLTRSTTLGFEVIDFAEGVLGLTLYPWQKWYFIHALELRPDNGFRFRTVLLLVARQNGKTTIARVLALWRIYVDGAALVIGTAQNLDVAEETWSEAVELAESIPDLAAEIAKVDKTNGKKALRLHGGQRYKVAAANRRGGRGLSGDLILLDELREHQNWEAWAAVTKTTMARARPQIICLSNAGDLSSVVLAHLRDQALAALANGSAEDDAAELAIFEWSAPDGCPVSDRSGWQAANPSLGYSIAPAAIAAAAGTDPEPIFRTEVLCQWVTVKVEGVFGEEIWQAAEDKSSQIAYDSAIALAVDVSWSRETATIAAAGYTAEGKIHVEVVATRAGTSWVAPWLAARAATLAPIAVALQSVGAPVSSLLDALTDGPVPVAPWTGSDLSRGTGQFYDRVRSGAISHLGQPVLDLAASVARTRPLGDSWGWDRKNSPADIAPLVASTAAVWALENYDSKPAEISAYETGGLVIV